MPALCDSCGCFYFIVHIAEPGQPHGQSQKCWSRFHHWPSPTSPCVSESTPCATCSRYGMTCMKPNSCQGSGRHTCFRSTEQRRASFLFPSQQVTTSLGPSLFSYQVTDGITYLYYAVQCSFFLPHDRLAAAAD